MTVLTIGYPVVTMYCLHGYILLTLIQPSLLLQLMGYVFEKDRRVFVHLGKHIMAWGVMSCSILSDLTFLLNTYFLPHCPEG